MRTETVKIYQYDELPTEQAKEKARDWFTQGIYSDSSYWEFVYNDAKQAGKLLGIEIDDIGFSGFCCQGDGAHFEGSYAYAKGAVKAIKDYAPKDETLHRIAKQLQDVQQKHFYKLAATCKHSGPYQHSGYMIVDVYHSDDEYRDIGDSEKEIRDILRSFADWIYRQLEQDYNYQCKDETVEENIRANGYEFYENGERA